jgi:hypothetical protein
MFRKNLRCVAYVKIFRRAQWLRLYQIRFDLRFRIKTINIRYDICFILLALCCSLYSLRMLSVVGFDN